jgi:Holliday junction resolvase RusA-like endonuclease
METAQQTLLEMSLPLFIMLPKKTKADEKYILNMNVYRNAHYQKTNQAKVIWKDVVRGALPGSVKIDGKVKLSYTIYPASNRRLDIANPLSIIDKYTCDALTELEVWDDDDRTRVGCIEFLCGEVDKKNPRCEMKVTAYRKDN